MTKSPRKDVLTMRMRNAIDGIIDYMPGQSVSLDRCNIQAKTASFSALLDQMRYVKQQDHLDKYDSVFSACDYSDLFYVCCRMAYTWLSVLDCMPVSDDYDVQQAWEKLTEVLIDIRDFS